jgi:hypothetical protein
MPNDVAELQQVAVSDDLLWGTQAIADYLGQSLHRTQYLIRIGALPIGKLGPKTIFASKRQLRQRLTPKANLTQKEARPPS